jgi:transcription elongation GreA/GreB family factor
VARALLGAEVGDRVRLQRPGGAGELTVLEIH